MEAARLESYNEVALKYLPDDVLKKVTCFSVLSDRQELTVNAISLVHVAHDAHCL